MLTGYAASVLLAVAGAAALAAGPVMLVQALRGRAEIRRELAAQRIVFPDREALPGELSGFAGGRVTTGTGAMAFAAFIRGNLRKASGGRTYAEISAELMAGGGGEDLANLRQTVFMGESLRASLMSAYQAWQLTTLVAALGALLTLVGAALLATSPGLLP